MIPGMMILGSSLDGVFYLYNNSEDPYDRIMSHVERIGYFAEILANLFPTERRSDTSFKGNNQWKIKEYNHQSQAYGKVSIHLLTARLAVSIIKLKPLAIRMI